MAPITVCLNEDTRDSYSGANFPAGRQQINAAQAVAFVRQRRDNTHPQLNFTDLDRERRQQAFVASLAYQLKQAGTFADPTKLAGLIHVAQQNTALDPGLDLLALAGQAGSLTSGNITFTTLPIDHFGTDPLGEDVNIVNLTSVQATVATLLDAAPASASAGSSSAAPAPERTVEVLNGGGRAGLAGSASQGLLARGYSAGSIGNAPVRVRSVVDYPPGDEPAATTLAGVLGISDIAIDAALPSGHLRVVLGSTFTTPAGLLAAATATSAPAPVPAPTDAISGGGIPCVK